MLLEVVSEHRNERPPQRRIHHVEPAASVVDTVERSASRGDGSAAPPLIKFPKFQSRGSRFDSIWREVYNRHHHRRSETEFNEERTLKVPLLAFREICDILSYDSKFTARIGQKWDDKQAELRRRKTCFLQNLEKNLWFFPI